MASSDSALEALENNMDNCGHPIKNWKWEDGDCLCDWCGESIPDSHLSSGLRQPLPTFIAPDITKLIERELVPGVFPHAIILPDYPPAQSPLVDDWEKRFAQRKIDFQPGLAQSGDITADWEEEEE